MHEVLLTRGHVAGCPDNARLQIHSKYNCVLVHPQCHPQATSENAKARSIMQLINFEGYTNIMKWLDQIEKYFKSDVANTAKNEVIAVFTNKTKDQNWSKRF